MNNPESDILREFVESDDLLEELSEYLEGGGDPNQNIHGLHILHVAAQSERVNGRIVQKLIDAGANIDSTTSRGHTPLQFAAMSRNLAAVQVLVEAGAQSNIVNSFGLTALHYAVDSRLPRRRYIPPMNMMRIITTLLDDVNIDVNPMDREGITPLMRAVSLRHVDVVKVLLKRGANPSITDQRGQNCLHVALAAQQAHFPIITELLLNGTCIYDADNLGRTPVDLLLEAYFNDRIRYAMVELLVKIIAFKYRVRKDLKRKLGRYSTLYWFLESACQEVKMMNEQIIKDKMTLHDFAVECFREQRTVYAEAITPVVSALLAGEYFIYLDHILNLISRRDFRIALESIFSSSIYLQHMRDVLNMPHRQNREIFPFLQILYQFHNGESLE